jgi:hypothetical protein
LKTNDFFYRAVRSRYGCVSQVHRNL